MFSTAEKTKPTTVTVQRSGREGSFFRGLARKTEAPEPGSFFAPAAVQTKLQVSTPGDMYEREADATSEQVMRMQPAPAPAVPAPEAPDIERKEEREEEMTESAPPVISRMGVPGEEENPLRGKRSGIAQRQEDDDVLCCGDDGTGSDIQRLISRSPAGLFPSNVIQMSGRGPPRAGAQFENTLANSTGGGDPLPDATRADMEHRFGADFSGVRIHTDATAQQMNRDIHAHAFTYGGHIYFNSGRYEPDSSSGKTLLAHELTHTVQQGASPARADVVSRAAITPVHGQLQRQAAAPQLEQAVTLAKAEEGKVNANKEGPDGFRTGWERLVEYFKTAMGDDKVVSGFGSGGYTAGTVSEQHIKKKSTFHGQVANQPPTVRADRDAMPSWCGIFVFWALNKGGIPMPKWTLGGGAVSLKAAYPKGHAPKTGDIAYRNTNSHYAIVEKSDGGGSGASVTSVNGNTAGEDNLGGQVQTRSHTMSQWDGFFNPLTLMEGNLRDPAAGDKDTKPRSLKELRKEKFHAQRKESDEEDLDTDDGMVQAKSETSSTFVTPAGALQRSEEGPETEEEEPVQRSAEADTRLVDTGEAGDDEPDGAHTAGKPDSASDARTLIAQTRSEVAARVRHTTPVASRLVQASWLGDAWDAVSGLAGDIADLIEEGLDAAKDWLLGKVRDFVMEIPGYKLLRVIMGYDPITWETVERTGETVLTAVLDLVPVGGSIVRSVLDYFHATEPVSAWLMTAILNFVALISSIGGRFEAFWDSLSIDDVGDPDGVIERIAALFRGIITDIFNFAVECGTTFLTMVKDIAITNIVEFVQTHFPDAFDLLCVVLGENPITKQSVPRTGTNILNAGLTVLGERGAQIKQQMMENGIYQKCVAWIDRAIDVVTQSVTEIKQGFTTIWNALTFDSLFHPVDTFTMIVDTFRTPVTRVTDFIADAVIALLEILKDALLEKLAAFARKTRGYFLITVILGRDPFTGKAVPRTVENLIHGFMSLMDGGEEQFQQMKESGAIDRTTQKIMAAVARLNMTWDYIVGLFTTLWDSMDWTDFLNPIAAFGRIVNTFTQPIFRLVRFVVEIIKIIVEVLLIVMNFPFDIVNNIIAKVMATFESIKRDPIGFLKNLLRAVKQGFVQFFDNILTHLLNGLADWFFFQLKDLGIQRPPDLSFKSILNLVLDILGISMRQIMDKVWKKLAEKIGQEKVDKIRGMLDKLEGIWRFITDVMERGPIAIWEYIQDQLSNLWTIVLDAAMKWITEKIITQVVTKLLSMLDPTGIMAVINSVIAIYKAVQSFIEYLRQMLEIVNSFVNGVAEIATGNIKVAADFLERTMARGIPIVIGFLANQVGLGKIGAKIAEIIGAIREKVDKAIDWLIDKAFAVGAAFLDTLKSVGSKVVGAVKGWLGLRKEFQTADGATHSVYFTGSERNAELTVASTPRTVNGLLKDLSPIIDKPKNKKHRTTYDQTVLLNTTVNTLKKSLENPASTTAQQDHETLTKRLDEMAPNIGILMPLVNATEPPPLLKPSFRHGVKGSPVTVHYLKTGRTSGGSDANTYSGATLPGWPRISTSGLSAGSAWVKMHLVTEQLGGPAVDSNLTPARGPETNLVFYREVEKHAIDAVDAGAVIWYDVTIDYHGAPNNDYPNLIKMDFGPYELDDKTNAWDKKPVGYKIDDTPIGKSYKQDPIPPPNFTGAPSLVNLNDPVIGRQKIENLAPGLDRQFAEFVIEVRKHVGSFPNKTNMKKELRDYYNTVRVYVIPDFTAKVDSLYSQHKTTYDLL